MGHFLSLSFKSQFLLQLKMRSGILDTGRNSSKKRSPRLRRKKVQAVPKESNNKTDANMEDNQVPSAQNDLSVDASESTSDNLSSLPVAEVMNIKVQEWVNNQSSECNSNAEEVQPPLKMEACPVQVRCFWT